MLTNQILPNYVRTSGTYSLFLKREKRDPSWYSVSKSVYIDTEMKCVAAGEYCASSRA